MRIVAGLAKGRLLATPDGRLIRPTSDRVREALFNILGQTMDGAQFMDIFAGSGAVGIEALSRGATTCVFVDSSRDACRLVRQNLALTGFAMQAEIHCREAAGAIDIAARKGRRFDYLFVDPPYERGLARGSFERIAEKRLLTKDGVLIVEHSKRERLPAFRGRLAIRRSETYGDTVLSFFTEETSPEE